MFPSVNSSGHWHSGDREERERERRVEFACGPTFWLGYAGMQAFPNKYTTRHHECTDTHIHIHERTFGCSAIRGLALSPVAADRKRIPKAKKANVLLTMMPMERAGGGSENIHHFRGSKIEQMVQHRIYSMHTCVRMLTCSAFRSQDHFIPAAMHASQLRKTEVGARMVAEAATIHFMNHPSIITSAIAAAPMAGCPEGDVERSGIQRSESCC